MAVGTLDQFLLNQSKEKAAKQNVPVMADEEMLPRGEVIFKPEIKGVGIPIQGATVNAQGNTVAPIKGINVIGNKAPIEQSKVDELKAIFKPQPEIPQVPPTPQAPQVPNKEAPKEEPSFDWKSLLPALAPLAVEAFMGTQSRGTAGEGAAIAAKHILDEENKKTTRKKELENKLIEMQQARDIASIKASAKGQKPLTTSNVLPYVAEDGKIKYRLIEDAIEEEKPTDAPKGLTYEQRLELQKKGQQFAWGKEKRKEEVAAGARFQQRLEMDKDYQSLKSQITNSQKAIEWLGMGKNIADVGIKRVFAKGIFGDVGNIAVQEQADIAGRPDIYSKYLTLRSKYSNPGVQFSNEDRADLIEFAQIIRDSAPKKLEQLANKKALGEKALSGYDVSDIAKTLSMDTETGETTVKVVVGGKIYPINIKDYPRAVREYEAKLYTGNK